MGNGPIKIVKLENGDKYEGQMKADMMHGRGTMYLSNGDVYSGKFKNNQKSGKGVYT